MTSGLVKRGFTYITNDWAKLFMYMVRERERERERERDQISLSTTGSVHRQKLNYPFLICC